MTDEARALIKGSTEGNVTQVVRAVDPDDLPQPLTLARAQTAKVWPGQKRVVPCNQHIGFNVSISPKGVRTWSIRVRKPGGEPRLKAIGRVPMPGKVGGLPWAKAFKKYEEYHGRARNDGEDISTRVQRAKASSTSKTIEQAHEEYLFAKGWVPGEPDAKGKPTWKQRTTGVRKPISLGSVSAYSYALKHLIAAFGENRSLWEEDEPLISRQDCITAYDFICARAVKRRGTSGTASAFNAMNYFSILWGFLNSARKVSLTCPIISLQERGMMVPNEARSRQIDEEMFHRWWALLDTAPVSEYMKPALKVWALYLRAVVLTGCRRREMLALRWEWVDLEKQSIKIPSEVVKNKHKDGHEFPIGNWLTAQLRALKKKAYSTEFVFAYPDDARYAGMPMRYPSDIVKTLRKHLKYKWSIHDLRRTYSTIATDVGVGADPYMLNRLLNHRKKDVTGNYPQYSVKKMRPWQQAIEDRILKLATGKVLKLTKEAVNG